MSVPAKTDSFSQQMQIHPSIARLAHAMFNKEEREEDDRAIGVLTQPANMDVKNTPQHPIGLC